ncbi:phosphoribosylpyrophosphate synthetase [Abyssalbus ytuae]|uniref:Phosphoribosylpyrophosphate synthetase n=2 Tax=Abyssalbus ytuae TaxID=2926907 RepID=A0A9E7D4Z1_9FLAO|nr:phosphoribosylpyrophosphate synthetase [Abyssalbus ytuae]UOB19464.1 phosphoribosylpyrophosphate synthetase [Abyssalbus ytuae]
MRESYTTLTEAISDLQQHGYTEDFNLCEAGVENKAKKTIHNAVDLNVVKHYRFEGFTNPADNMVLYVIETTSGEKGLLVDAYGAYSGNISHEMIEKLRMHE